MTQQRRFNDIVDCLCSFHSRALFTAAWHDPWILKYFMSINSRECSSFYLLIFDAYLQIKKRQKLILCHKHFHIWKKNLINFPSPYLCHFHVSINSPASQFNWKFFHEFFIRLFTPQRANKNIPSDISARNILWYGIHGTMPMIKFNVVFMSQKLCRRENQNLINKKRKCEEGKILNKSLCLETYF